MAVLDVIRKLPEAYRDALDDFAYRDATHRADGLRSCWNIRATAMRSRSGIF